MSRKNSGQQNLVPMHNNANYYNGILVKQAIPADNSCLFTSIRFCLNGYLDNGNSAHMRQVVAQEIVRNKHDYNEAMLNASVKDYCAWIRRQDAWGGAIEIAILSNFYGVEIDVVNTQSGIINRFGENRNYDKRIFILFNGVHYDALFLTNFRAHLPILTMFPLANMNVFYQAQQIAQSHSYVREMQDYDMGAMVKATGGVQHRKTYRCLECDMMLLGTTDATHHKTKTGHKRSSISVGKHER